MNDRRESDTAGVIAHPPVLYLGFLLAGLAADRLLGLPALPYLAGDLGFSLGTASGLAGLALLFAAAARFIKAGTNIPTSRPSTALVTGGLYRFSRNPIYLGLTLIYLGLTLGLASLAALLFLPLLLAVMQVGVIQREERYLEAKFGEPYRAYKQKVRRWL
ncbi:isoprenylcysteine carboxylmethyltransferase family protein [Pelagibius litoralis]|uniref:Isoprenylcysteine carboxylmethyltransferase family protein n=1 Tax=Pelagibius litoralis TaxID=374515 RepID=A0A967EY67_9PROT|nr:isoprenylcysteine carboxylmethyltransferase family protein [Pelagibius litoralis]NIA69607.1 isoprenylcysteine carboxylmethyltransferase family protein [Pelagibius litoralis]